MGEDGRLYERAAVDGEPPTLQPPTLQPLGPLWHVGAGVTFFAGPLDHNASHQHGAPVYLGGIHGCFGLRINGGRWLTCRSAVIPAGLPHELDIGGNPLAVFYVEPSLAGAGALTPLVRDAEEVDGALVGGNGELSLVRALYEDRDGPRWAGAAMADLLSFSKGRAARNIDPRLSRAIALLERSDDGLTPVADLAAVAGLSSSRFQHLFTEQVGVPFRRYRAWNRMRAAIGEVVAGGNFTRAAHAAGFADQAHFAHDFRRTFGAPASRSLVGVRRPCDPTVGAAPSTDSRSAADPARPRR